MKPESALTPPVLQMGTSRIERIPKGVVFVMGAWNFPFHLSLTPCIAAIAAGNCVVLKPSDVSPASAQQLKELCEKYMDPSAFMTFLGGVEESTELLARKWNHIFYTGNAVIGRVVMTAAAKHLCPVTLELGGGGVGGQKLGKKHGKKKRKRENWKQGGRMITPNIWSIYECYNLYVHIVAQTKFVYIYIFIYIVTILHYINSTSSLLQYNPMLLYNWFLKWLFQSTLIGVKSIIFHLPKSGWFGFSFSCLDQKVTR